MSRVVLVPVTTDITSMDADTLNYWLSKFVLEVANSAGKRYLARTIYDLVWFAKAFDRCCWFRSACHLSEISLLLSIKDSLCY